MKQNKHFNHLPPSYLFEKLSKLMRHGMLNLSIGDTSLPIPPIVSLAMQEKAEKLATTDGYSGYGPAFGADELREKIAHTFYPDSIDPSEVFISDGAKCDIGRLQILFGSGLTIAVQDPSYPVYVDTSILMGAKKIVYLKAHPNNDFFSLPEEPIDLLFLCSPNNPTGSALTHSQLEKVVSKALAERFIIIFDTAYAPFIQDQSLPRTIYEIEGAKKCAIEVSSFSKLFGFTGLRLGWSIVPKALLYESRHSVHADWSRIMSTFFNGASSVVQAGGLKALECSHNLSYYQENAHILKEAVNYPIYGGDNAPYLWVDVGQDDTLFCERVAQEQGILLTPGSGFGPSGKGFVRISALADRKTIVEAAHRLSHQSAHC